LSSGRLGRRLGERHGRFAAERNREADFRKTRRSNATHVSTTDKDARCWVRKAPEARSRTSASLIGVSLKAKSSTSLASGSLAMVSWCLIERACFSEISTLSKSPTKR